MRRFGLALAGAMLASSAAIGCELKWDYGDSSWLEGFRVFQGGKQVGLAAPEDRSGDCAALGLVAGPGPVTMTAYRGPDESPQSDPAEFELSAPGVTVRIAVPSGG